MGRSRADIIMVTENNIFGIEIKSDAGNYSRLPRQIEDYDKYYDQNIVVVGTSHANHIEEHIPEHWGIITVEEYNGKADFYMLRAPKDNPRLIWERKMEILWKSELAIIQNKYLFPKYQDESKQFIVKKILSGIPQKITKEILKREISEILFERDYTRIGKNTKKSKRI